MWKSIREIGEHVDWLHVIWFSQSIPRHASIAWLITGEKLTTQNKLKDWDSNSSLAQVCVFCSNHP